MISDRGIMTDIGQHILSSKFKAVGWGILEMPEIFFNFGNGFIYIFGYAMWGLNSQIRGRPYTPAVESQSLNHCTTTREVPRNNEI